MKVVNQHHLTPLVTNASGKTGECCGEIVMDFMDRHHVMVAVEDQLRRLGQELHDDLGQEITGAALMVEGLLDDARRNACTGELLQGLERVNRRLQRSKRLIRDLSHGLVASPVDASSLYECFDELVLRNSDVGRIRCYWQRPSRTLGISAMCATQLYRIAQEAMTNALKHSLASELTISIIPGCIEINADSELRIQDNGNGMVNQRSHRGTGLFSMQDRANLIGGTLQLVSLENSGTTVICQFKEQPGHDCE